jgi:hypothetical protein
MIQTYRAMKWLRLRRLSDDHCLFMD